MAFIWAGRSYLVSGVHWSADGSPNGRSLCRWDPPGQCDDASVEDCTLVEQFRTRGQEGFDRGHDFSIIAESFPHLCFKLARQRGNLIPPHRNSPRITFSIRMS
jgi:hypothetical protein